MRVLRCVGMYCGVRRQVLQYTHASTAVCVGTYCGVCRRILRCAVLRSVQASTEVCVPHRQCLINQKPTEYKINCQQAQVPALNPRP
eukprot:1853248-Rhodomonas_salina.1